jgi:hypothetical protein
MLDPRHGRGAALFAPTAGRYLRLDPRLPARAAPMDVLFGGP